jgi:hypothetical protein
MGYGSVYERDLFLRFERCLLVEERELVHSEGQASEA